MKLKQIYEKKDEPKLWNFYADVSLGGTFNQNVNNVSKTRTKQSSDDIVEFGTAKYDHTFSGTTGLTATRSVGEVSSLMFNLSGTASQQDVDTTDDYESFGLTFAFDTSIDKHTLSPYLMLSRTDYATDAINMSTMVGFGNYYLINDSHSINYGYFYIDSKSNTNYIFPLLTVVHFVYLYVINFKIKEAELPDPQMRNLEYALYIISTVYIFKFFDIFYTLTSLDQYQNHLIPSTFLPIGIVILILYSCLLAITFITFAYRKQKVGSYVFENFNQHMDPWP